MDLQSTLVPVLTHDAPPRCHAHPKLIPSVAMMIDGVLANRAQYGLDLLVEHGINGYHGVVDADKLDYPLPPLYCSRDVKELPPDLAQVRRLVTSTPHYWLHVPAYEDVNFPCLRSHIHEGAFLAHFIAFRFPLDTTDGLQAAADHRQQTRMWLDLQFGQSGVVADSINADLCPDELVAWLKMIRADYFLTANNTDAFAARAAGIEAYVLDRPWNRGVRLPFRVPTVCDFLAKTALKTRD